jgi:assimilatory nitrate reductase electron transfer subunit
MAGARVASELHARDRELPVTVLGAEPHRAYNRILLSSLLAGKVAEPEVELTEPAGRGLDLRLGVKVTAIDRAARTLSTVDGVLSYGTLVLATGSEPLVPPIDGLDGPLPERVSVFRTLDDCRRILRTAGKAESAIVLGGGLLGLEAARGLALRGLSVRVVHAVGHLMERQLDPAASAVLISSLEALGITVHLDAGTQRVEADEDRVTVTLADGLALYADLFVVACGTRPETALARRAGLAVERGIVVDDQLRTTDPRIFAIGDCAQHAGVVGGLVAPAWEQARVVADVITGRGARYHPTPPVTRLKATGIDLAAMGSSTEHDGELVTFADPARGTYAKLVLRDNRVAGAILLGDNPAVGTVIQLFDRGAPVPADRRSLLLGRASGPATPATDSPALIPDSATICQCNTVSKGALVAAWRAGARTTPEVVAATRATTGCGSCRDAVCGLVEWLESTGPGRDAAPDAEPDWWATGPGRSAAPDDAEPDWSEAETEAA